MQHYQKVLKVLTYPSNYKKSPPATTQQTELDVYFPLNGQLLHPHFISTDIKHRQCGCLEAGTTPRCFPESSRAAATLRRARAGQRPRSRGGSLHGWRRGTGAQHRVRAARSPRFAHLLCGCLEAKSPPSDSAIF